MRAGAIIAPALCLVLTGCSGSLSTLEPAGPSARAIATLWWIMLGGSTVIFLATTAALVFAVARPAVFRGQPWRVLVLWGGLILPSIILATLVFSAFALGERLMARTGSADPVRIEAEGRQWEWEFRYPDAGLRTIGTLHIPVGRQVEFEVTSADVIHSFWVPRLGGKIDAIPGHRNRIRLMAEAAGTYGGVCAEFCGIGHEPMRFTVVAHPEDEYEAVLMRIAEGGAP